MSAAPTQIKLSAFAKINLDLHVLGRRPDGYHELRTTFQSVALADTLTFTRSRGPFRITCDDLECPTGRSNLVWRAASLVWRAAGRRGAPKGVTVHIDKRVPVQAGLGGGSSDAATARVHTLVGNDRGGIGAVAVQDLDLFGEVVERLLDFLGGLGDGGRTFRLVGFGDRLSAGLDLLSERGHVHFQAGDKLA